MKRNIRVFAAALVGFCVSVGLAAEEVVSEFGCAAVVDGPTGDVRIVKSATLLVLESTAKNEAFALPPDVPALSTIRCSRSTLVPAPNDYKVLAAGFPLYIVTDAESPPRVVILELHDGQFVFGVVSGTLTAEEAAQVQARVNEFQRAIQKAPAN